MRILGFKPAHDGAVASLCDGRLEFSIEAEKDSQRRYNWLTAPGAWKTFERLPALPDAVALSGWEGVGQGYFGLEKPVRSRRRFCGQQVEYISSTHEKSHLFGAYAMSPFEQGRPCYALVWEGDLGAFYRIGEAMQIEKFPVLTCPGLRYSWLFYLADWSRRSFEDPHDMAGKLMALAGFGTESALTEAERALLDYLFEQPAARSEQLIEHHLPMDKRAFPLRTPFFDIGLESQAFRDFARKFTNALFRRFHDFAAAQLTEKLPLLIGGGCGLNCEWNAQWRDSGLFADVFVPPCANDSGSAIGAAAEAQYVLTGNAKIDWSVYAGEEFVEDCPDPVGWDATPLDFAVVAEWLRAGRVVAWVQGRYEIGPRALGNRSLLAAPFAKATEIELNRIKEREDYRPIAPVCLREEAHLHFEGHLDSPHMLYFQRVKNPRLAAVTHVDGSARAQTVTREENPPLHALLTAFKAATGTGVLCNTSLNFKGKGFINRTTDLLSYADARGIDTVVINERMWVRDSP
jgi:predicted NodU family carbamoyl transferase